MGVDENDVILIKTYDTCYDYKVISDENDNTDNDNRKQEQKYK